MTVLVAALLALQGAPFPREKIEERRVAAWEFEGEDGWRAVHDAAARAAAGSLVIQSTGGDPYLEGPPFAAAGPLLVRLRAKSSGAGPGEFFWATDKAPGMSPDRSVRFEMAHDGGWHEYEAALDEAGTVTRLRLDPGMGPGRIEVDWIRVFGVRFHPVEVLGLAQEGPTLRVRTKDHGAGGKEWEASFPIPPSVPFPRIPVVIRAEGLPEIRRTVVGYNPDVKRDWVPLRAGAAELLLDPDGAGAVLRLDGRPAAIVAPFVAGVEGWTREGTAFRSGTVTVSFGVSGSWFTCTVEGDRPVEGPVVRALGPLEAGLFAGIECLGRGEASSSRLDVETPEHVRYAPDPMKVTMPLMACATDRGLVTVTWSDMALQPVFAAPNVFDGSPDHRMALRGRKVEAAFRADKGGMDLAVLETLKRRGGLAPLPEAPRSRKQTEDLYVAALKGPLRSPAAEGWGHCAEASWNRAPFGDHASAWWRLTGEVPALKKVQPGGAHVPNDAIFFVTGRAPEWLNWRRAQASGILREQKEDGSFRYDGPYRRGHWEDTASGLCAQKAMALLEFARWTGDRPALEGGVRALETMKRFQDPRGAQTWEMPLHTPDILGSAYLVWSYVRGFELTGRREYLDRARFWAVTGVPFVYQWGNRPTMAYSTIAVLGATNWKAPNWIGLPVQWCGGTYAYALALLAPHDRTLDWKHLARGILLAGERMMAPEGDPLVGCLPDSFSLAAQRRNGPFINPCAWYSLRRVLDGELDSLAVATDSGIRVVAPFPVEIRDGKIVVRARPGARYSVLVNGSRITEIESRGTDEIAP
jgi:hypothetical protein